MQRHPNNLRVVKLGGSLLTLPDLTYRIRKWIKLDPQHINLWVIGGGNLVEVVREFDRVHPMAPEFIHWFCVDLLAKTSELVLNLLPEFSLVDSQSTLERLSQDAQRTPGDFIVPPQLFYDRHISDCSLPQNWQTTTDSIAALLAKKVGAYNLTLLKSCEPPTSQSDIGLWAQMGYVDEHFADIAAEIPHIRSVNLRAETWAKHE